jgi:hypothetical protein
MTKCSIRIQKTSIDKLAKGGIQLETNKEIGVLPHVENNREIG